MRLPNHPRPVTIDGICYPSMATAARELKMIPARIYEMMERRTWERPEGMPTWLLPRRS